MSSRRLRASDLGISGKQIAAAKAARELSDRLAIRGKALIVKDGVQSERSVRMWDALPRWWNQATSGERRTWVTGFFRAQLKLADNDQLLSVKVSIPQ